MTAAQAFFSEPTQVTTGPSREHDHAKGPFSHHLLSTGNLQLAANADPTPRLEYYLQAATAENTRKAYQADLRHFLAWGGTVPSTPEQVANYLATFASNLSPATLSRRIAAITRAHTSLDISSPTRSALVKTTLRGIRRARGNHQRRVHPILKDDLTQMLTLTSGIKEIRDRALLLIGFSGAFRRSELVAIDLQHISWRPDGLIIAIPKSKTDQLGAGRSIAIPYATGDLCPVTALQCWLEISKITSGKLFRAITRSGRVLDRGITTQSVALIVKTYARQSGLDARLYSAHSLRAGLVTSAAMAGISTWKIQQQTGHKSIEVLARYVRDANLFQDNAAGLLL